MEFPPKKPEIIPDSLGPCAKFGWLLGEFAYVAIV
jgi:hypothetical protein